MGPFSRLLLAWCLFGNYSARAYFGSTIFRVKQHAPLTVLNSQATPINERIDPAKYRSDLYDVLGVSRTSSTKEIRDAYWAIVVTCHPDKNSSQEALELFRNASYAYKVLGKDAASKSSYDYTRNAENLATALTEVGTDIVMPLATEVAVPLINLTFRGIGSVAKPLLRDFFGISSSLYKAAVGAGGNYNNSDLTERLATAYIKTREDQYTQRQLDNIEKVDRKITEALDELETAVERQVSLRKRNEDVDGRIASENQTALSSLRLYMEYKEQLAESKRKQSLLLFDLNDKEVKRNEITAKSEMLAKSIENSQREIQRLELALAEGRQKLQDATIDKEIVDQFLGDVRDKEGVCREEYSQVTAKTTELTALLDESGRLQLDAAQSLSDDVLLYKKNADECTRQTEYISILERKLRQLKTKKTSLEDVFIQNGSIGKPMERSPAESSEMGPSDA